MKLNLQAKNASDAIAAQVVTMTIQEYKQQLYDACKEHIFLAQQALDRYSTAKTDREREYAKIDNIQHLAAHNALQWALYKASEIERRE